LGATCETGEEAVARIMPELQRKLAAARGVAAA